ncbi:MAG: ABC transporter ATP-binding protein [Pseudomonadota bacterium]|nr:ABC transporter ATP-binding protein [Pseudomonadota bacterium]
MSDIAVGLNGIAHTFRPAGTVLNVLEGATTEIAFGEMVALVAPSGAGKSTLLHIAGLLERPDSGEVVICGQACSNLSDDQRTMLRRQRIGFVYQFHHLLPEFSALENVAMPQIISGIPATKAKARAWELISKVGLKDRAAHRPAKLSGGEQQRVAIARALANRPRLLIADEPTGNLDQETAESVFDLLVELANADEMAVLVATHNHKLASLMNRTLTLSNGVLEVL